jgi:O-acetyl-ADP-ribose deacetylase (regulator of RNase III)
VDTDILTAKQGVILHGCNLQGRYASGLAAQIANRYPLAKASYLTAVESGHASLGGVDFVQVDTELWVANAFTQTYYGRQAGVRYADPVAIAQAYARTCEWLCQQPLPPILHYPSIGAGLGGLSWQEVLGAIAPIQRHYWHIWHVHYERHQI